MAAPCKSAGGKMLAGILVILLAGILADEEFEGSRTLQVEHSFGQEFSKRGTVVIQSLKSNKAQFSQAAPLSSEEREELEKQARDKNGVYRLRIPVFKGGSSEPTTYVSTFAKACSMYESGLRDHITVNFDQTGEVLGVSIFPEVGVCSGAEVSAVNLTSWRTTVDVVQSVAGPTPDTQTYLDKLKRDEQERSKGQQGDNRSFFGKYWMYIVPFVIMMIIMSSADPNAAGGGGGAAR